MDWFIYDNGLRLERVNPIEEDEDYDKQIAGISWHVQVYIDLEGELIFCRNFSGWFFLRGKTACHICNNTKGVNDDLLR